jgi:hypothetical protein
MPTTFGPVVVGEHRSPGEALDYGVGEDEFEELASFERAEVASRLGASPAHDAALKESSPDLTGSSVEPDWIDIESDQSPFLVQKGQVMRMLAAERGGEEGHVPFRGVEVDGVYDRDEPIPVHDGSRNLLAVVVSDIDDMAAGHEAAAGRNGKRGPGEARSGAIAVHADDREHELVHVHASRDYLRAGAWCQGRKGRSGGSAASRRTALLLWGEAVA